ncbi:hypothetical protein Taro_030845 [Colocasia esculenta]|uniref:Uncharacterized protein n=1 Tax=Colocasia esculenta TaxID=4460 RepID=A0A843VME8_COLES|nr:hypothetical protein [Colocasia esculenta]
MGYFVGGLCQPGTLFPSRDSVCLHGDEMLKQLLLKKMTSQHTPSDVLTIPVHSTRH